MHGTTGTNYTIESSTDLKAWTRLVDGLPQNGILATELPLATGGARRFFRGRKTGGATIAARDVALLPPVMFFNGTTNATNVTGNATVEKFINDPPTDGRYQWDFERHRAE